MPWWENNIGCYMHCLTLGDRNEWLLPKSDYPLSWLCFLRKLFSSECFSRCPWLFRNNIFLNQFSLGKWKWPFCWWDHLSKLQWNTALKTIWFCPLQVAKSWVWWQGDRPCRPPTRKNKLTKRPSWDTVKPNRTFMIGATLATLLSANGWVGRDAKAGYSWENQGPSDISRTPWLSCVLGCFYSIFSFFSLPLSIRFQSGLKTFSSSLSIFSHIGSSPKKTSACLILSWNLLLEDQD